jgi:hypothetical protein
MPANIDGSISDPAVYEAQLVRPALLERLFHPWFQMISILPSNETGFVQWPWSYGGCIANHASIACEQ